MTDTRVAAAASRGAAAPTLWTRHKSLARTLARDWRIPGMERQDVEQEALIGLWEAARAWTPYGGASFPTFARTVISRRLVDTLKAATRRKHSFLNDSARVDASDGEAVAALPCLHQITDHVDRERLRRVIAALPTLTDLERHAVLGIAAGIPYADLGPVSVIDNAAQRARRKLRAAA